MRRLISIIAVMCVTAGCQTIGNKPAAKSDAQFAREQTLFLGIARDKLKTNISNVPDNLRVSAWMFNSRVPEEGPNQISNGKFNRLTADRIGRVAAFLDTVEDDADSGVERNRARNDLDQIMLSITHIYLGPLPLTTFSN